MNPFKKIFDGVEAMSLDGKTDVISLIKADHRRVDVLFETYIKSDDDAEKENVLKEIISNLRVHATAEENKVYPSLDSADHDGANESLEEHHLIKILIEELSSNRLADDKIDAKVKVLSEVVKHHVKEEESKYLPELQGSGADLQLLGQSFTSEKERLLGQPDQTDAPEQVFDNDASDIKDVSVLNNITADSPEMKEDFPRVVPGAEIDASDLIESSDRLMADSQEDLFNKVPLSVLADDAVEVKKESKNKAAKKAAPAKKAPPVAKKAAAPAKKAPAVAKKAAPPAKKAAPAKKASTAKKVVATKKIAPAKKIGGAKKVTTTTHRKAS